MANPESFAPWACNPAKSRGRLHREPESAVRSCFQRDRDRIIHSAAFRRLEYKTQVFVNHEGDFFRTRLTHSLEVSQIARSVCRVLRLNEDLAEALALAHDLGHPPFGHAGEDALKEMMAPWGGFDHNAQSLRIVTALEQRYAEFDGLNLTWETLEGVVKHNGPLIARGGESRPLPAAIAEYASQHDLELATHAGAEAQIASLADDIAYNNHDIDDGLRAGLFSLTELREEVPMVERVLLTVERDHPGVDEFRTSAETIRRLIGVWIDDLMWESNNRIEAAKPQTVEDVRAAGKPLIGFSDVMNEHQAVLRRFLMARMYRHWRVNRSRSHAKRIIRQLFELFIAEPELLPPGWQQGADGPRGQRTARRVCDYIAGMTDDFAIDEHKRLFRLDR